MITFKDHAGRTGLGVALWQAGRGIRSALASSLAPAIGTSEWRRKRLLIISYHGISIADEHDWDGYLYMPPEMFRRRLQILRDTGCNVLPLDEGIKRLQCGTLPKKAVVITFDDGFHDFASVAAPLLLEFGFPATNYINSYYGGFHKPIFDITLSYLLWKADGRTLDLPRFRFEPRKLDAQNRAAVKRQIQNYSFIEKLTGAQKDSLLEEIACALDLDYQALCRRRLLHSMNACDVNRMHRAGFDIQLHTHRHRVSRDRSLFEREIHENRKWIQNAVANSAPRVHFSYPGGSWEPVRREWLTDLGIETAATSIAGLAAPQGDLLLLPRFIDHALVDEVTFKCWLAGSRALFPRRAFSPTEGQLLENNIHVQAEAALDSAEIPHAELEREVQNLG